MFRRSKFSIRGAGWRLAVVVAAVVAGQVAPAGACTRFVYRQKDGGVIVGRSMDWFEDVHTDLWAFPRGMTKDGGAGEGSIRWTSKYGSVAASLYDVATVDGMNEAGLVGNVLYLAESDYGTEAKAGKPGLSVGAWLQYVLDNYGSVAEAVEGLKGEPFRIVAPALPGGKAASGHLAICDRTGDSAIFEYLGGKLVIHHGPQYAVMTNSPSFDRQLAINAYWEEVGGRAMLPGTYRAADRFVRTSYYLEATPKFEGEKMALGAAFSIIRNVSVPLGLTDPERPNLASTIWRTVSDAGRGRYYFESAISPSVFWVDLDKLDLKPGARPSKLEMEGYPPMAGEMSGQFKPAEPFHWLGH